MTNNPLAAAEPGLATITGLDLDYAQTMVGDDPGLYTRLLRLFLDTYSGDAARVREWVRDREWGRLRELAHSVKGAAGSLGATDVSELAAEIQALATRSAEDLEARAGVFADELQRLLADLETVLA